MAIRHLVWACAVCGREGTLQPAGKTEVCNSCGTTYTRGRGSEILVREQGREPRSFTPRDLAALLPSVAISGTARGEVREWVRDEPLRLSGRYLGRYECLGEPRSGTISLDANALGFAPDAGSGFAVSLLDITAIQPSSSTLQIKAKNKSVFSIRFTNSSPKLWEDRLHLALNAAYRRAGLGEIAEYQPRVALRHDVAGSSRIRRVRSLIQRSIHLNPKRPWQYRLASWIARNGWRYLGGGVAVEGISNLPRTGPFLVLANHQSYLETLLVPAVMPRAAHMMAKSTQFAARISGWLMARLFTFPVRRFEIDPQAMRYTIARLSEGYGVVIFIEGERTWDGTLQPLRLGTVRLALEAGVPVIPCRVSGAFDAWPRWSSKTQRRRIHIAFGSALTLPNTDSRAEREARLDEAVGVIAAAIDPETRAS